MATILALLIALFGCIIAIAGNWSPKPLSGGTKILFSIISLCFLIAIVVYATKNVHVDFPDIFPSRTEADKDKEKTEEKKEATNEETKDDGVLIINQDQLHDQDVVQWTDPTFEKLVRAKIGKPTGPVYVEDLDYILDLAIYGDKMISVNFERQDGTGFRCQSSNVLTDYYSYMDSEGKIIYVQTLGEIKDISSLIYFRELYSLSIIANKVSDISIIGSMPKISSINVWGNQITDLSYIDGIQYSLECNKEQNISIGDTLDPDI